MTLDIFEELDRSIAHEAAESWQQYVADCSRRLQSVAHADPRHARKVLELDLSPLEEPFARSLAFGLREFVVKGPLRAIHFEFDLDNDWESSFFFCGQYWDYEEPSGRGDEWAAETDRVLSTDVCCPGATKLYSRYDFCEGDIGVGCTTLLVAKTYLMTYRGYLRAESEA